jgi:hypothetical protein
LFAGNEGFFPLPRDIKSSDELSPKPYPINNVSVVSSLS